MAEISGNVAALIGRASQAPPAAQVVAVAILGWSLWLVLGLPHALFPGGWYYAFAGADIVLSVVAAVGLVLLRPGPLLLFAACKVAAAIFVAATAGGPGAALDVVLASWVLLPAVAVAAIGVTFAEVLQPLPPVLARSLRAAAGEVIEVEAGTTPHWFTPSLFKLLVMDLVTFGLYTIYWNYREWAAVKAREGTPMMPFWRGVFSPIWFYFLLKRMAGEAGRLEPPLPLPAGLLALLYLSLILLTFTLPGAWDLLSCVTVIPILIANHYAIRLASARGALQIEQQFSALNWFGIIVGGILWLLNIIAA